jgi:hypothetical protein
MMTQDTDLLVYEPALFRLWKIDHQQRGKGGNGTLNGTAFSAAGVDFSAAGVQGGDVVYLSSIDGMIDGCYEIVEVVSATQLTVSMLRAVETDVPIAVGVGNNLIWRISSFAPQRALAERMLLDRLQLSDEMIAALGVQSVWRLRSAVTFATLGMIFESLIQQKDDEEMFGRKKEVYQQMLETAITRLRLDMDFDGDGQRDTTLRGEVVCLNRE